MKQFIPCLASIFLIMTFSLAMPDHALATSYQPDSAEVTGNKKDRADTYVRGFTSARVRSLVGSVLGVVSIVVGWRARSRVKINPATARSWAIAAVLLGSIAIILSIVHLTTNHGGFGTGGGRAGAIIALALGVIGTAFGGQLLRLARI